jgi:hypothetical protein
MRWARSTFALVTVVAVVGCGSVVSSAIDTAARRTGEGIGNAVGNRAGAAMGARLGAVWGPQMMQFYTGYLFSLAFHSGSYAPAGEVYDQGEWTKWRIVQTGQEGPAPEFERAFLRREADGSEWWRVRYVVFGDDGSGQMKPDTILLEGKFSPDRSTLVRLRGKMPGDAQANEMPVEENTYGYVEPTPLTAESLQGATVGTESVSVPAGTYSARHVRYGAMGGGGTTEWWLNDDVPGGMVKYSSTSAQESSEDGSPDPYNYTVELLASGSGATSATGI